MTRVSVCSRAEKDNDCGPIKQSPYFIFYGLKSANHSVCTIHS